MKRLSSQLRLLAVLAISAVAVVPCHAADLPASNARFHVLRLKPGQDIKLELQSFATRTKLKAGFIASGTGSVSCTALRFANQPGTHLREGHFEVVSLNGTLEADGMHVHAAFADSTGATIGGRLMDGSVVHSTLEIVIGELGGLRFTREVDPTYGYRELAVKKR